MRRLVYLLALLVFTIAARAEVGEWVTITLKNGREHFGQIVEETDHKLVVSVQIGKVTSKLTFARSEIAKVESQGYSDDKKTNAKKPGATPSITKDDDELEAPAAPPAEGNGGYAIVPLKGAIGELITSDFLRAALTRAKNYRAEAVIFVVDSPGGMVLELERLREELDRYKGDVQVVFYTDHEAFSAAALLCLSSRKFYVGDGARVGAAVSYSRNSSGSAEVDAKFNSAFAATWRALAEKAGRPGAIVDAMVLPEKALYADTSTTPWKVSGDEPADDAERKNIRTLDTPGAVLSLTADEAVATGAADGKVASPRELVGRLGLNNSQRVVFDGESLFKTHQRAFDRNMVVVRQAIDDYTDAIKLLKNEKTAAGARDKLRDMRSAITRVITLYRKHDYVRNAIEGAGDTIEDYERLIRKINELLKEL